MSFLIYLFAHLQDALTDGSVEDKFGFIIH